jgi:hypothetical protein
MKLKVLYSDGKPRTELSQEQQKRFIKEYSSQQDEKVRLGIEWSLILLGYEVVEGDAVDGISV